MLLTLLHCISLLSKSIIYVHTHVRTNWPSWVETDKHNVNLKHPITASFVSFGIYPPLKQLGRCKNLKVFRILFLFATWWMFHLQKIPISLRLKWFLWSSQILLVDGWIDYCNTLTLFLQWGSKFAIFRLVAVSGWDMGQSGLEVTKSIFPN